MKKILLGLFLILGVVSFAAPKYVDKAKLKKISEEVKTGAPAEQKFVSSRENKRAYVNKFKANDGSYTYSIVAKKTKIKNCYISILYITAKDFKDNELDKVVDKTLNEVESYLK